MLTPCELWECPVFSFEQNGFLQPVKKHGLILITIFSHYSTFLSRLECVALLCFFQKEIHRWAPNVDSDSELLEGKGNWHLRLGVWHFYLKVQVLTYMQKFDVCSFCIQWHEWNADYTKENCTFDMWWVRLLPARLLLMEEILKKPLHLHCHHWLHLDDGSKNTSKLLLWV